MFRSARGFAMPVVVAIVAVFATILGTALVTLSSAHQAGSGLDFQGVRAYYAARAGLEWGMFHILRNGRPCTDIQGRTLVFDGNLSGFRATLSCAETAHNEGGVALQMYSVTSTACNANPCTPAPASPPAGYANRALTVTLSR